MRRREQFEIGRFELAQLKQWLPVGRDWDTWASDFLGALLREGQRLYPFAEIGVALHREDMSCRVIAWMEEPPVEILAAEPIMNRYRLT